MKTANRDYRIDLMKAFAILCVFVGHIMQYSIEKHSGNPIHNTIWAIQMPLFMFISGYLSTNGGCLSIAAGLKRVGKRAVAYLVPFLSWFYIVRVLLLGAKSRNVVAATVALISDVQASFWFLWVVFVLCVIFTVIDIFWWRVKSQLAKLFVAAIIFAMSVLPWMIVCMKVSGAFLGSKFILYYSLFFGVGFLVKKYKDVLGWLLSKTWIKNVCFTGCLVVFAAIVLNVDLYAGDEGLANVLFRIISAYAGIAVVGLLCMQAPKTNETTFGKITSKIGKYTLEIYVVHMLLVTYLPVQDIALFSVKGYVTLAVNAIAIAAFTCGIICLLKANRLTDLIFFGKLPKNKKL